MNSQDLKIALNILLPDDGSLPEWVELIPAGDVVAGRDTRKWINPDPESVVGRFASNGADLPIDWEHATEIKAPRGEAAPAAGWIKEMEVRAGAIWARVSWNDDGAKAIQSREYRYLSPVFMYTKADRRIVRITSAGLTNQPNLHLKALNREETDQTKEKEMEFKKALCTLLGLSEETDPDKVVAAVQQLQGDLATARNREQTPSLDKFVPRGDYDSLMARAQNAEQKLEDNEKQALDHDIETALSQALEAGVITPASKEYHKAQCRTEGGLERFKSYVETAPKIAPDTDLDDKAVNRGKGALSEDDKAVCRFLDITEDDYLKTKKEIN